jgi:hypothetical protein
LWTFSAAQVLLNPYTCNSIQSIAENFDLEGSGVASIGLIITGSLIGHAYQQEATRIVAHCAAEFASLISTHSIGI